jgi:hypothetical protein
LLHRASRNPRRMKRESELKFGKRSVADVRAKFCASKAAGGWARPLSRRRPTLRAGFPVLLGLRGRLRNSPFCPLRGQRSSAILAVPPLHGGQPSQPCAARRRPFAAEPTRPQPCGQRQRVFVCSRSANAAWARGWCPDGAHGRRRAAERREGRPGGTPPGRREGSMQRPVQGRCGVIAAALSERAAERGREQSGGLFVASRGAGPPARRGLQGQRTLAAGEGGDG